MIELPEIEVDITINNNISKNTSIKTNDYTLETGIDEYGFHKNIIPNYTNLIDKYKREHLTPIELLNRFKFILEHPNILNGFSEYRNYLIEECDGWINTNLEINGKI